MDNEKLIELLKRADLVKEELKKKIAEYDRNNTTENKEKEDDDTQEI